MLMNRLEYLLEVDRRCRKRRGGRLARLAVITCAAAIYWVIAGTTAKAQAPQPFVPDVEERSGLVMRFAATPEILPPDKHRDNFYNTRYADKGYIHLPNWYSSQG